MCNLGLQCLLENRRLGYDKKCLRYLQDLVTDINTKLYDQANGENYTYNLENPKTYNYVQNN